MNIQTVSLLGINGVVIDVEVDIKPGLNYINIIGMADKSVYEAKDRVISALKNANLFTPKGKVTVSLSPSNIPKSGNGFDLPIAAAILAKYHNLKIDSLKFCLFGEFTLQGMTKNTDNVIAVTIAAKNIGFKNIILPAINAPEAGKVEGINIISLKNIGETADALTGKLKFNSKRYVDSLKSAKRKSKISNLLISRIKGQSSAKKALEIAISGSHNIIIEGAPGTGKTFLARAAHELLPMATGNRLLEINQINNISDFGKKQKFLFKNPFRTPHHRSTVANIIGGGMKPRPGEASLAHNGILFVDEINLMKKETLNSLLQPLEDKIITLRRGHHDYIFPADFILIGAMNPCECGNYGLENESCSCSNTRLKNFKAKVPAAIWDRIDIKVYTTKNTKYEIDENNCTSARETADRIENSRIVQFDRFKKIENINTNGNYDFSRGLRLMNISNSALNLLKNYGSRLNISYRSYEKTIKLARTIADLEQSSVVNKEHMYFAFTLKPEDLSSVKRTKR
jgi:magnesium chelatase family protein